MESLEKMVRHLRRLSDEGHLRLDVNESAHLARELEFIKAKTYDIRYPTMKARQFVPTASDVDPGADTITYWSWDWRGMAKVIANYADDLPSVDAFKTEHKAPVVSIGDSYSWSIQDLRRSAMAGSRLDTRRAAAARMAVERKIDEMAAFGEADTGITGFLNNANVPLTPPVTGTWSTATPAQIVEDLNTGVQAIIDATMETEIPDTVLLDTALFGIIAQTPIATDNQTTILKSFLANNPYIRNIDQWTKLALADAAGTGPRCVFYRRSPDVLTLEIPQDFEQFPPQERNLAFVVNTHARVGGVLIYYPLAITYMDGC